MFGETYELGFVRYAPRDFSSKLSTQITLGETKYCRTQISLSTYFGSNLPFFFDGISIFQVFFFPNFGQLRNLASGHNFARASLCKIRAKTVTNEVNVTRAVRNILHLMSVALDYFLRKQSCMVRVSRLLLLSLDHDSVLSSSYEFNLSIIPVELKPNCCLKILTAIIFLT